MGSWREHKELVDELYNSLKGGYLDIRKEILYHDGEEMDKNPKGEMDVVGWNEGYLDIYEVKSNGDERKACKQLKRAKKYFSDIIEEVNTYYYSKDREIKEENFLLNED